MGVSVEQHENRGEEREDRSAGMAVLCIFGVLFLTWGAYLLVFVGLLLGKQPWLTTHLLPFDQRLALISGYLAVPLCVFLAIFRRTRLLSGMALFVLSGVFTFVTCAYCAWYVYSSASHWAMVLGTLLMGYGIMPTAAVWAATHHYWKVVGQIVSGGIMLFSTLYLGLILMTLSFSSDLVRPARPR